MADIMNTGVNIPVKVILSRLAAILQPRFDFPCLLY
jgi:hypothetical protein